MNVEQSLTVIIEGTDSPDPVLLSDFDSALPPEWI
jgi:hypothetical protein